MNSWSRNFFTINLNKKKTLDERENGFNRKEKTEQSEILNRAFLIIYGIENSLISFLIPHLNIS